MKKMLFMIVAGILISCGGKGEEKEVELEDYNQSDSLINPAMPAIDAEAGIADSLAADSTAKNSAQVKKDTSATSTGGE